MPAPQIVLDLVQRFRDNLDAYLNPPYNETQLRREFLDPLFTALGWDVDNTQSYAEAYKDVIHEDLVKVGGLTKAPDYSFRVGGGRKFFLEAKKPAVNLKQDTDPAFQLRRYAWSAKLPLSVLSNFREFVVYDCRKKPVHGDAASTARIQYFTFEEYAAKWDEIAATFSKEAVLKGSFDKYAGGKGRRGTAEVDAAFLDEIESWRDVLARNIALRNHGLSVRELNFAVQQTIDRIIFLRIAEDRGIEQYAELQALVNGTNVYARLRELFHRADERYNSGIFHFRSEPDRESPDTLTPRLVIDDKSLKDILNSLYYPESPYEFSVLPADILGQVYEQFLGKVIRLTAGGQAKVEDKPEVKKAGGVYYTPTYIVAYIVKQIVGRLVEGKKPDEVAKLKVLDPACGSGSFLLGAYQFLLDWHLEWYTKHNPERHAKGRSPKLFRGGHGEWRLTTRERKHILLNNIYGVDIDPQAVEVTKLSLLLKVLEVGRGEMIAGLQSRERVLPDLDANIKCGNSLIGPDFYATRLALDEEEQFRINAFDWGAEFSQVFSLTPRPSPKGRGAQKRGMVKPPLPVGEGWGEDGFDAVIGNPPYIRIQTMKEWAPLEVDFYKQHYAAASKGNYDIYVVFVERGLSLLNEHGRLGFILPHKFFNAHYGEPLRGLIAEGSHLFEVLHFGHEQIFADATTYTCLLFLNRSPRKTFRFEKVASLNEWRQNGAVDSNEIASASLSAAEWNFSAAGDSDLRQRLAAMPVKLGDLAHIFVGLQTSADKIYVLEHVRLAGKQAVVARDAAGQEWELERALLKPFLSHVSLASYERPGAAHWLIFPYRVEAGRAELIAADELAAPPQDLGLPGRQCGYA